MGALVLWFLINKWAWPYIIKHHNLKLPIEMSKNKNLTILLGIIERGFYTTVLIMGAPNLIAVWLALKVVPKWNRWEGDERVTYNVFLIGNVISVAFGIIGAWIALGKFPKFSP